MESNSNFRILVAEDNPSNQKVMLRFLDKLGYSYDLAADGAEAVEVFLSKKYDLVFLDCQMPKMDGYEAALKMRESELKKGQEHTPLIALTAHAFASDRLMTQKSGMDDYLTKPMSLKDLDRVIARWLKRTVNTARWAYLESLNSNLEPDIICELAEVFFSYGVSRWNSIQVLLQDVESGSFERLEREAHALKSVSVNLGLLRLTEVCERIETAARQGKLGGIKDLQENFKTELNQAFDAAKQSLSELLLSRKRDPNSVPSLKAGSSVI